MNDGNDQGKWAYKAVALGSSSVLICDNNSLMYLPKLLKITPHCISLGFPGQASNKDFSKSCVIVLAWIAATHHLKLPLLRHDTKYNTKRKDTKKSEQVKQEKREWIKAETARNQNKKNYQETSTPHTLFSPREQI